MQSNWRLYSSRLDFFYTSSRSVRNKGLDPALDVTHLLCIMWIDRWEKAHMYAGLCGCAGVRDRCTSVQSRLCRTVGRKEVRWSWVYVDVEPLWHRTLLSRCSVSQGIGWVLYYVFCMEKSIWYTQFCQNLYVKKHRLAEEREDMWKAWSIHGRWAGDSPVKPAGCYVFVNKLPFPSKVHWAV